MINNKPIVSVIIPTYNRKNFLIKSVNSVLKQTYKNFELIIIDDASSDETAKEMKKITDNRLKYFYLKENKGPSFARNYGIKKSMGKLIAFLDSDDWWKKDKLEKQVKLMNENKGYYLSHTEEIWYLKGKFHNPKKKHKKIQGDIFAKSLKLCMVSMSTVMVRKELFKEVGYFDENLRVCEDYDFWLRVSLKYPVLLIDEALTLKDGGRDDQVSRMYVGLDKFRAQSLEKIFNTIYLDNEKKILLLNELIRKLKIYSNGCLKRNKIEEHHIFKEKILKYSKILNELKQ